MTTNIDIYRVKAVLRLEKPLAGRAIVVNFLFWLTTMLVQTTFTGEDPITSWTIVVGIFVVILQFTKVVEMIIATLAIGVARTLNPMFFQPHPGWKVLRAILADVVMRGILYMLTKSWPKIKGAVASVAVGSHDLRSVQVARSFLGK